MAKANGELFGWLIKEAADNYRREHPEDFEAKIKVEGYDRWKKEVSK